MQDGLIQEREAIAEKRLREDGATADLDTGDDDGPKAENPPIAKGGSRSEAIGTRLPFEFLRGHTACRVAVKSSRHEAG